ncbi:MAG: DUF1553 domain-containing protein [Pirellulales bacterium]
MHRRATINRFTAVFAVAASAWLTSGTTLAQDAPPGTTKFPAEHAAAAPNPDKQASDTTESVARRLPRLGSTDAGIVERNLIDRHLLGAMQRDNIPHARLSIDHEFLRRVYLDLTGRIPSLEQLTKFVEDKSPDKRDRIIDELLASEAWVDHWGYWYGDLFRNCANRIGNAATKHFDAWLRQCLKEDRPYDQIVTDMLTATAPNTGWLPDAAPAGFIARWHVPGETMYSDRYEDTADEVIVQSSRVFLGINYQCISCHGGTGFLEKVDLGLVSKKRSELWAMAAFFGQMRVRIVPYQDRFAITEDGTGYDTSAPSSVRLGREGDAIEPTFILSGEKGDLNEPLRPQFARMLTKHPQFARATVNLIWKQFFGLGIVEPVDGFDMARQDPRNPPPAPWTIQPRNPELLDALAKDFAENGLHLKHLMRTMARSSAYQLSSRFDGEWRESYTPYFARHFVRVMTAEQIHDSVAEATQVFGNYAQRDMLYGTRLPRIQFVTQTETPENINDSDAGLLLRTFGQANREQSDRRSQGSILQALTLMNSPFVTKRVQASGGSRVERLVKSEKDNAAIVDELYLATLSRPPLAEETRLALSWLEDNRQQGAEDLQWVLLNKLDFVFNY